MTPQASTLAASGDAPPALQAPASAPPAPRQKLFYALAIFASAFLLFQVQPLITKLILPWFGGVAAVWTVALVFFQVVLLFGYFYAHILTSKFPPRLQSRIHAALLALSLLALPILPRAYWKPVGPGSPAWHILLLLAATVGLPYLVLSATSPLLQAWYASSGKGAAPYRFYALSNLGSMLALLTYPVFFEPFFATTHQAFGWSLAYAAAAILVGTLALTLSPRADLPSAAIDPANAFSAPDSEARDLKAALDSSALDWKRKFLWIALTACASALLLAITNHISQNIASVPFLWVIPLALYLLSFILCFDRPAWYHRGFFLRLLGVALGGMAYALDPSFAILPMKVLIPVYCVGLWICCMFCHGELVRLKPHPAHLTSFYLMCSLGGAIGAVFVALIAPRIFSGYYELHCALGFCAILVLVTQYRDPIGVFDKKRWQPAGLLLVALVIALLANLGITVREQQNSARLSVRNFYGVLRVIDHDGASDNPAPPAPKSATPSAKFSIPPAPYPMPLYLSPYQTSYRRLMNGTIDHGLQFLSPQFRRRPTSYYSENSGVGIALKAIAPQGPLHVGLIGLGAGTLAAYGRPGDRYTFYEINPLDVRIAREQFTFLRDSPATIDIVIGDARLSLESEPPQQFDVLVVDAFSSDSIPVHLLTREAFELYFRHLKPEGVLALHTSNQYLDLQPVVLSAAAALRKEAVLVKNPDNYPQGIYSADWILVGSPEGFFGRGAIESAGAILLPFRSANLWTDNYSSLFRLLK